MFMYHINISGALRHQCLYTNIALVQQHSSIFIHKYHARKARAILMKHKHLEAAGLSIYKAARQYFQ